MAYILTTTWAFYIFCCDFKEKKVIQRKEINILLYRIYKMHFCKECQNMYYIRLAEKDKNKLVYYCRKCGDEEEVITEDNI